MDDFSDDELNFDTFTTNAKASRTLETYMEKNRRLVKFACSSEIYKVKVDTSKPLYKQLTLPLTVDFIKAFFNAIVKVSLFLCLFLLFKQSAHYTRR
jgi:hypothetical protein